MRILFFILMITSFVSAPCQTKQELSIQKAVEQQMNTYPRSTLRDLYKNFFQDKFGPGHILADTTAAGKYLRSELKSQEVRTGPLYEPTGYEGNFYRVNLSVLKMNVIPYRIFFDAFVRSINGTQNISIKDWIMEWHTIEAVIMRMNLELKRFEEDKLEIESLLQSGKYAMHHSRDYVEAYDPHYRIIEKTIFENELLPLINKNNK